MLVNHMSTYIVKHMCLCYLLTSSRDFAMFTRVCLYVVMIIRIAYQYSFWLFCFVMFMLMNRKCKDTFNLFTSLFLYIPELLHLMSKVCCKYKQDYTFLNSFRLLVPKKEKKNKLRPCKIIYLHFQVASP